MPRTLIVHYTHRIHPSTQRELARLLQELPAGYEVAITGCCEHPGTLDPLRSPDAQILCSTRQDLRALPYEARRLTTKWRTMRGSPDLALLHLYRQLPHYDTYWFIEHDVRYTGHWASFFETLSHTPADLLATRIYRHTPGNRWPHWHTFQAAHDQPQDIPLLSAFLPIHRASARLLHLLDTLCQQGWTGHPEVLWPTAAAHHGLLLEEIGGNGPFTPKHRRRLYYRPVEAPDFPARHTFTATPPLPDTANIAAYGADTLWHPVKG